MNPPFDAIQYGGGISRLQELLPSMRESGWLPELYWTHHVHGWALTTEEVYQMSVQPYVEGDGIQLRGRCPMCDKGYRGLAINVHRSVFYCHSCGWKGGFNAIVQAFDEWYFAEQQRKLARKTGG